jgi:hypothetical protein
VDPVPDPLLRREFGRAENRTWDLWVNSKFIIKNHETYFLTCIKARPRAG